MTEKYVNESVAILCHLADIRKEKIDIYKQKLSRYREANKMLVDKNNELLDMLGELTDIIESLEAELNKGYVDIYNAPAVISNQWKHYRWNDY